MLGTCKCKDYTHVKEKPLGDMHVSRDVGANVWIGNDLTSNTLDLKVLSCVHTCVRLHDLC